MFSRSRRTFWHICTLVTWFPVSSGKYSFCCVLSHSCTHFMPWSMHISDKNREKCITRRFIICSLHRISLDNPNKRKRTGSDMKHTGGTWEMHTEFLPEYLKVKYVEVYGSQHCWQTWLIKTSHRYWNDIVFVTACFTVRCFSTVHNFVWK